MSDDNIIEGEITEDSNSQPSITDQSSVITSLDNLIKSHIATIERLSVEIKKQREMVNDTFANDAVYQEQERKAKEATKLKNATKQQLLKQPSILQIINKLKGMTVELKEKQSSLSDYLLEYQRMTGVNEIEGEDGEVREIIHVAKVVKRTSKK